MRESGPHLATLGNLGGWEVLVRAIQGDLPKLATKACFFLGSACEVAPEVAQEMVDRGMVLQLAGMLAQDQGANMELVLRALLALLRSGARARQDARGCQGLVASIEVMEQGAGEEEQEVRDYCQSLLQELGQEEEVEFVASQEWQTVEEGQKLPGGLHIRSNLTTGVTEAKLPEDITSTSTSTAVATIPQT